MEKLIKKKVGKTIPHELIYNVIDDLDYIRRMKKRDKSKEIEEVLQELNEAASIADEAYNSTKSETKKKKIEIFIRYNNARLELVEDYINNGMYDTKLNLDLRPQCPEGKERINKRCLKKCDYNKERNPATNRCIKKTYVYSENQWWDI